jgi:sigma-B regulation protein RsbU (phosphoserine phosphatase)
MLTSSLSPNAPPAQHPLPDHPLILGRAHDAHICLASPTVSRRHAQLAPDPFGRWWIRDLNSHNGTLVNGNRITELLLKPGDLIQLGEFSLTLSALSEPPHFQPTSSTLSIVDNDHGHLSSLGDFEPPRLAATHLSLLSDFGQQLLTLDDPAQRLLALCRLMVRPEFRGTAALALRASKDSLADPPKPLCEPQSPPDAQTAPYISKTLIRTLLARNEPILASNCNPRAIGVPPTSSQADHNLAELSIAADVLSIAAVACPLQSQPAFTDLLYVLFPPDYGTSEWLALTSLAVKQFTQAESTWAARRLGEEHAAIERELARAHKIQERLVPRDLHIPGLDYAIGFAPCRWVGGDYVDLISAHSAPGSPAVRPPTVTSPVLLTIADVCGKGLPAALVAYSLHMLTHTAMRSHTPLPDIMRNLNFYLAENLPDGTFVTMLATLLDPSAGTLQIINAGHPAGFLIAPDGGLRKTQHSANLPLGIDPRADLITDTATLDPGSFLVLFTDGLSELHLEGGDLLGEPALASHLSRLVRTHPSAPAAAIAADLTALLDSLQEGIARDDRTFLLARRL